MSVDPHAAGLYTTLDSDWRAKTLRAGWYAYLPVVGWPMVLGYRKALTDHFFQELPTAMPAWRGRHGEHLWNGLRAIGVIQGYLLPLWIYFAWSLYTTGFTPGPWTWAVAALCVLAPIFTNIVFPCAVFACSLPIGEGPLLAPLESAALSLLFHIAIFLVPAGFLRVSATGRFLAAFNPCKTLPFIARRRGDYLRAWWYGLWMNWPVLPLILFRPWILFWAYVASLVIFNQMLVDEPADAPGERPRGRGWLHRAYGLRPDASPDRAVGAVDVTAAPGRSVRVLRTPFFSVPFPRDSKPR